MIGARGGAKDMDVMIFDHQHHDECGANRIDYCLKSKYRQPGRVVPRWQDRMHCKRHQKDSRMEAGHHDGRCSGVARPAPFTPELHGDEEGINRYDHGTENLSVTILQYPRNLTEAQPDGCADEGREGQHAPPLEQTYAVPDHS